MRSLAQLPGGSTAPPRKYCVGFLLRPFSSGSRHGCFVIHALPRLGVPCLAVVPQGGVVVPRLRKYRPQPLCYRSSLATTAIVVVPRFLTVVPHGLAVVPLVWGGSTAGRGLVGG